MNVSYIYVYVFLMKLCMLFKASPNHNMQSPEVTSKAAPPDDDPNDGVKILTEKLSAAAATISAKEELVKQHAKVAEEAVTGIFYVLFPNNICAVTFRLCLIGRKTFP